MRLRVETAAREPVTVVPLDLRAPRDRLLAWRASLTEAERARADRFVFPRDGDRFVASRGQLREQLGGWLGQAPAAVVLDTERNGKPYLPDAPELLFNLSHTRDRGLLALTWRTCGPDERLGVDLEATRPLSDLAGLARTAFSRRERAQVLALPPEAQLAAFYEVWTKKEAVIKAFGDGIAYGLGRFSVPLLGQPLGFEDQAEEASSWTVVGLDVGDGAQAALAHRCPPP
jgi:4'-phosphopantetheinyl transferase